MQQNRREFITRAVLAGAALPYLSGEGFRTSLSSNERFPVRLFSKPLDSYDTGFMCECLVRSGIRGFDLTVRPGGKVEPSRIEHDLPGFLKEADKHSLAVDMMVTSILSSTDRFTESVLKVASENGIKHYRLGWFGYDLKSDISKSVQKFKTVFNEIAEVNRKYKITGSYQNHSGTHVGAPVWDLNGILEGIPRELLGIQYDVRHAMVEGTDTWILGLKLIADHISTLALKDFIWMTTDGKPQPVTVPLGEGMIDWDLYFGTISELQISCPITLHIEYPLLEKNEESLSSDRKLEIISGKIKKDFEFINRYLKKFNLV